MLGACLLDRYRLDALLGQARRRCRAARLLCDLVAGTAQLTVEDGAVDGIVIDDQDAKALTVGQRRGEQAWLDVKLSCARARNRRGRRRVNWPGGG